MKNVGEHSDFGESQAVNLREHVCLQADQVADPSAHSEKRVGVLNEAHVGEEDRSS